MRSVILSAIFCLFINTPVNATEPTEQTTPHSVSFSVSSQPADLAQARTAKANQTMLSLTARALYTATLNELIPFETTVRFGAQKGAAFDKGSKLYGWPEYPGLFCDLLRAKGIGFSAPCLRDTNGDGGFDEGVRLEFDARVGHIMVFSHKNKIIGARFDATPISFPHPVAYTMDRVPSDAMGRLSLLWRPLSKREGGPTLFQLQIATPDNFTGTSGYAEKSFVINRDHLPQEVNYYGIKLNINHFDDRGALSFSLKEDAKDLVIPLVYDGNFPMMINTFIP